MKIIRVGWDIIKVVLSAGDLRNMNIDARRLTTKSPELNLFLCEVMEAVKAETGFSPKDRQILVEASPLEEGMVLTLSYTENAAAKERICTVKKTGGIVFEFLSFESLTGMLKNVPPSSLIYMRLYSYCDRFYLAVPRRHIPILIYEYSFKNRKSPVAESVLAEYGKFLAGGCKLMTMSAGLKKLN